MWFATGMMGSGKREGERERGLGSAALKADKFWLRPNFCNVGLIHPDALPASSAVRS